MPPFVIPGKSSNDGDLRQSDLYCHLMIINENGDFRLAPFPSYFKKMDILVFGAQSVELLRGLSEDMNVVVPSL